MLRDLVPLLLLGIAWAGPVQSGTPDSVYDFNPDMAEFYSKVSDYINSATDKSASCDVSTVSLPPDASGLPAPNATLKYVLLGIGTQNYTCVDSTASTEPKAAGAVANLYDASCLAANYPDLLLLVTKIGLNQRIATAAMSVLPPSNINLVGYHYFSDKTTAVFNLDTTADRQFGVALSNKVAQTPPPADAVRGPNNEGNGAVDWLYLRTIDGTTCGYTSIYRVNTAGGKPPETCAGMPEEFTVDYSANYFMYA